MFNLCKHLTSIANSLEQKFVLKPFKCQKRFKTTTLIRYRFNATLQLLGSTSAVTRKCEHNHLRVPLTSGVMHRNHFISHVIPSIYSSTKVLYYKVVVKRNALVLKVGVVPTEYRSFYRCTVVSRKKLTFRNRTYKSTNEFSRPFICTTSVPTHDFSQTVSVLQAYCKCTTHVHNFFRTNSCP